MLSLTCQKERRYQILPAGSMLNCAPWTPSRSLQYWWPHLNLSARSTADRVTYVVLDPLETAKADGVTGMLWRQTRRKVNLVVPAF